MPISFTIDHDRERIYTKATGVVTFGDLYAHMKADVGPGVAAYSEIFDCTGATTDITAGDVRMLVMHRADIAREQARPARSLSLPRPISSLGCFASLKC